MRTEKISLPLVLRYQRQHDRLAGLLANLKQEEGKIEPEVMEEVRRAWPAPGESQPLAPSLDQRIRRET